MRIIDSLTGGFVSFDREAIGSALLRRAFVAGNWKMNLDLAAARALVGELRVRLSPPPPIDVAICPPSIYLFPMAKAVVDSPIGLGAQNCWFESSGAFTGEGSPARGQ